MFSNLSKGSILHGVSRGDKISWFTGSVERVTPSLGNQYPTAFGQFPSVNLDIAVTIDGRQTEFKGIHSNESIADFGKDSVILADNKDSLYSYVKSLLKTSEDAVDENNLQWHREMIPQYREVLSEMMPGSTNLSEVKELKEQVGSLQAQLAEAIALIKKENAKT